jgi:hypothetical protein
LPIVAGTGGAGVAEEIADNIGQEIGFLEVIGEQRERIEKAISFALFAFPPRVAFFGRSMYSLKSSSRSSKSAAI